MPMYFDTNNEQVVKIQTHFQKSWDTVKTVNKKNKSYKLIFYSQ